MKNFICLVLIFSFMVTNSFSQNLQSVNICFESDWKFNHEMAAVDDSIYEIEIEINKNYDLDKNYFVGAKFRILYDNGYKWIGGSFPSDTTGDMSEVIRVPYGVYTVKLNVYNFKYQFINPDNDFYKFSNSELDSNDVIYSEIVGTSKLGGKKVTINIDYGQYQPRGRGSKLVDEKTGQPILFNSMIDALNYMGKFGWEFVQAYTITMGNSNVYHYLLKKSNLK